MQGILKNFKSWVAKNCAATAIEYAMIAAGLSISIVIVIFVVGDTVLNELFVKVAEAIGSV